MKSTKQLLRDLREDADLKQSEVAELIGTTQQQYSKYENGESELPVRVLLILADRYNVSTDYLLSRTELRGLSENLNKCFCDDISAGAFLSESLALDTSGRRAVADYVYLQHLKQKYGADERK